MLAVKGIYDNGQVIFEGDPPMKTAEVIVVFPDSKTEKMAEKLSSDKKKKLFEEFSGSVNRMINLQEEKLEVLDKRYESID